MLGLMDAAHVFGNVAEVFVDFRYWCILHSLARGLTFVVGTSE